MRNAIFVLVVLAATPVFADQAQRNPEQNARFGALRGPEVAAPYKTLFDAQPRINGEVAEPAKPTPKVVCGMLLIPTDPAIDPKMLITPPKDPKVEHSIRAIDPPICNPISRQ